MSLRLARGVAVSRLAVSPACGGCVPHRPQVGAESARRSGCLPRVSRAAAWWTTGASATAGTAASATARAAAAAIERDPGGRLRRQPDRSHPVDRGDLTGREGHDPGRSSGSISRRVVLILLAAPLTRAPAASCSRWRSSALDCTIVKTTNLPSGVISGLVLRGCRGLLARLQIAHDQLAVKPRAVTA